MLCSVAAEKTDTALEIARRIDIPEIRVSYLLDAYEQIKPMPASVSDWPIHFWKRTSVSIQENNSPNKVPEDTARKLADPQH